MCLEKTYLTAFIDESGSITKTDIEHHKYFIIAFLFTRNSKRIKRYFQKGIAALMQDEKYRTLMSKNGEIKGSEVSETKKNKIYDRIIRNCKDDFEIGISVFDKGIITRHLKNGANLHQTTPDRRYWGKLKAAVFARYGRSPLGAALFWLSRRPPADPGHSIRKV